MKKKNHLTTTTNIHVVHIKTAHIHIIMKYRIINWTLVKSKLHKSISCSRRKSQNINAKKSVTNIFTFPERESEKKTNEHERAWWWLNRCECIVVRESFFGAFSDYNKNPNDMREEKKTNNVDLITKKKRIRIHLRKQCCMCNEWMKVISIIEKWSYWSFECRWQSKQNTEYLNAWS